MTDRARLIMFWDYDTQWGADRSRAGSRPATWGGLEFPSTERLLELHEQHGIPACFAVVGSAALPGSRPYHDPDQVRRIHAAGHEVGSHSHRHEWLPGLDRAALRETLRASKDALEQCIGSEVSAFVPPWNQPFDYPAGWSISLSERREARGDRTDLRRLCETLRESGYRFCRVAYRSLFRRLADRFRGRRVDALGTPERISGITCVRLSAFSGFAEEAGRVLDRCVEERALAVVYGHPHSLTLGDPQDERYLVPFLARVRELRATGALDVLLPRDLAVAAVGGP